VFGFGIAPPRGAGGIRILLCHRYLPPTAAGLLKSVNSCYRYLASLSLLAGKLAKCARLLPTEATSVPQRGTIAIE
jgi:hypothetical protein